MIVFIPILFCSVCFHSCSSYVVYSDYFMPSMTEAHSDSYCFCPIRIVFYSCICSMQIVFIPITVGDTFFYFLFLSASACFHAYFCRIHIFIHPLHLKISCLLWIKRHRNTIISCDHVNT